MANYWGELKQGYRKQIVSGQAVHLIVKVVVTVQLRKQLQGWVQEGDVPPAAQSAKALAKPMSEVSKCGFSTVMFEDYSSNDDLYQEIAKSGWLWLDWSRVLPMAL